MAVTHICLNCGLDLARVRAQLDSDYDLWIVRCPRCETCCARRSAAWRRKWANFIRIDMALSIILVQCIVAFVLLLLTRIAIVETIDMIDRGVRPRWHDGVSAVLVFDVVLALLTGVWLTAGLGHNRLALRWLGWPTFILLTLIVFPPRTLLETTIESRWEFLPQTLAVLIPLMIIAALGIPLGLALRWLHGRFRWLRWRWRRRQHRKWAAGT